MSNITTYSLLAFVASTFSGFVMIPLIMNFCKRKKLYDLPNERKVHKNAIPRLGGISFMPSMVLAGLLALLLLGQSTGNPHPVSLWTCCFIIGLLMIYIVGIVDDLVGLTARSKFAVQILAASLLPLSGLYINQLYGFLGIATVPFWIGALLTVFIIVFIDNAINLIDGIDGLAAGLSFMALGGFWVCFYYYNLIPYCVLIAGMMGVLVPYLYFNIWGNPERHHKIFMGDSGSLTLGFILGVLFVKYAMDNPAVMEYRREGLAVSVTMLIVPMFDVVRVVITRFVHHRALFEADKNHLHHKLMRAGLDQHQTLVNILSIALLFGAMNMSLVYLLDTTLTFVLLTDVVLFFLLDCAISHAIRRKGGQPFV